MDQLKYEEIMALLEADSDLDDNIENDDEVIFEVPQVKSTDFVLGEHEAISDDNIDDTEDVENTSTEQGPSNELEQAIPLICTPKKNISWRTVRVPQNHGGFTFQSESENVTKSGVKTPYQYFNK